jgi:regulator of sigma E protease
MLTPVAFIVVIGVLITIHEAGHFAVARILGAPVEVFSIGFGKRLWGFKRNGTDYRISLIPLGGYVRIVGLGPDESDVVGKGASESELLPRWKRTLILLAGPLTNIVAAVAFVALAFAIGVEVPAYRQAPPVVGWVAPESSADLAGIREGDVVRAVDDHSITTWDELEISLLTAGKGPHVVEVMRGQRISKITITLDRDQMYGFGISGIEPRIEPVIDPLPGQPAAVAGIQAGDRIVSVNGQPVEQYYDLPRLIEPLPEQRVEIEVVRDHQSLTFEVETRKSGDKGKIGVGPLLPMTVQQLAPVAAVRAAVAECRKMTYQTFRIIGQLLTGKTSIRQMSGPVGIAQISGEAARSGFQTFVMFMGIISLQLGIFNLLPIPILDGGHLAILTFESIIRRDLPLKVKERILEVGFYLLILLMVVVTFNDVVSRLPENLRKFFFRG